MGWSQRPATPQVSADKRGHWKNPGGPRCNVAYVLWMVSPDPGVSKKAALILGLVLPFKVEGKPKEKKKSTIYFFLVGCGMKDISFAREDFGGGSCNFECYDGAGNIGLKLKKTKTFPFGNTTMKCFVVPEFIYFI